MAVFQFGGPKIAAKFSKPPTFRFEKASILRSPAALRKIRSFFYCLALRHAHVILAGLLPSPYARKILSLLPSAFRNT
jgi:hypothetical protein